MSEYPRFANFVCKTGDPRWPWTETGAVLLKSEKEREFLLIDGDTPHRSCAGFGPRPVALFTYIKTGFPFRPGRTQQRAEVAL